MRLAARAEQLSREEMLRAITTAKNPYKAPHQKEEFELAGLFQAAIKAKDKLDLGVVEATSPDLRDGIDHELRGAYTLRPYSDSGVVGGGVPSCDVRGSSERGDFPSWLQTELVIAPLPNQRCFLIELVANEGLVRVLAEADRSAVDDLRYCPVFF